ncbi:MAG TPA: diaminopimelate epimerase [Nitrospirae bacterium]|nr:diaminopimelate epimerase [Nitrospirota bacterium]
MKIDFLKMHGLGNDFILIDTLRHPSINELSLSELSALSQRLCRRRFGVGADQLLLLCPSEVASFRMRIFNADGSEVQMCGNGIRCLARYIWDSGLSDSSPLEIETMAGIIRPERAGELVRVNMGVPLFNPEDIPVKSDRPDDIEIRIDSKVFRLNCVSMGNPHAVIIADDLEGIELSRFGPLIENHPLFPERTNVEFVQVLNPQEIRMRVWERGVGETLACGTGASASAVVCIKQGMADQRVTVHLLGGDLVIEWDGDGPVYMTGPAVAVFEGTIDIS